MKDKSVYNPQTGVYCNQTYDEYDVFQRRQEDYFNPLHIRHSRKKNNSGFVVSGTPSQASFVFCVGG